MVLNITLHLEILLILIRIKKDKIERIVILDIYHFAYGYPQPVTLYLLTDIPIDTIRNILSSNEEYSELFYLRNQKIFRSESI